MTDVEAQRLILGIASFIESRKIDAANSMLVPNAAEGFNLACDFLSHQLRELLKMGNRELLRGVEESK